MSNNKKQQRVERRFRTEHSGWMEIIEADGETYFDTEYANYSYGTLQRILSFGLSQCASPNMRNVLILGLGGGSVVHSLRKETGYMGKITAVDIDKVIIEVAMNEFGLSADRKLSVIHTDALDFVATTDQRHDLIVVDLFIHTQVPEVFYDVPFWLDIHRLLKKKGMVIFNASVGAKGMSNLRNMKETMGGHFLFTQYDGVEGANTLLIGKRKESAL